MNFYVYGDIIKLESLTEKDMKTQFIVHPDEISKNLIDELVQNNVDCLGIHPVGGKDAYKTLEDLVLMLKTPEFRTLLDYAKERGLQIEYELHSIGYLMPKSLFSTHPEYFRVNKNGERSADYNFCVSNSKAMEIVCNNAVTLAKSLYNSSPNYYFWIDDGSDVFCSCEKCRNISPSDQTLMVTNAIAAAVRKEIPSAQFAYLAYMDTISLPTIKKEDGIFLEYAPFSKYTAKGDNAPDLIRQEQLSIAPLISYFGKDTAKVLEYWFDNSLFSGWKKPPKKFTLNYNQMKQDVHLYKEQGFNYISTFGCYLSEDYKSLYGAPDLSPMKNLIK